MELRQLEHFVAVAEERHFTRAAQRQAIAQSALSASVRTLEHELGTVLFRRSTRHVDLTESGRLLLVEARRIFAAVQAARDAIGAVEGLDRGRLRIGYTPMFGRLALQLGVGVLARFRREHPGVDIRLRQAGTAELIQELQGDLLDTALMALLGHSTDGLAVTVLALDQLVIACSPDHALAGREHVTWLDIAGEPYVDFAPPGMLRQRINRSFAATGHERQTAIEVDTFEIALRLVASGFGVTAVPGRIARDFAGVCALPLVPAVMLEVAAVTAESPPLNPAARTFLNMALPLVAEAVRVPPAATAEPGTG